MPMMYCTRTCSYILLWQKCSKYSNVDLLCSGCVHGTVRVYVQYVINFIIVSLALSHMFTWHFPALYDKSGSYTCKYMYMYIWVFLHLQCQICLVYNCEENKDRLETWNPMEMHYKSSQKDIIDSTVHEGTYCVQFSLFV